MIKVMMSEVSGLNDKSKMSVVSGLNDKSNDVSSQCVK